MHQVSEIWAHLVQTTCLWDLSSVVTLKFSLHIQKGTTVLMAMQLLNFSESRLIHLYFSSKDKLTFSS